MINDVRKVSNYLKNKDGREVAGYVLYYTHDDTKNGIGAQVIINRFNRVNNTMRDERRLHGLTHRVDSYICDSYDPPWGFALFRL